MKTIRTASGLLAVMLLAAGCATAPVPAPAPGDAVPELDRVHEWLIGRFETRDSASKEARRMIAVPILAEDPRRWIYVAQWRISANEPDRQFVYRLVGIGERGIALDLYSLSYPLDNPTDPDAASLAGIDRSHLQRRKGCRIQLSPDGLNFVGGTRGGDCPTDYRGAVSLRIELTVRKNEVREWLQGYDSEGNRLWSADDVGRIYRRTGKPRSGDPG